jgi:hypothetical protein
MKVSLRHKVLSNIQQTRKMTDQEFSCFLGISRSQLWRSQLPTDDKRFSLGQDFIAKVLKALPEYSFEDIFFLNNVSHGCYKDVQKETLN